MRRRAGVLLAGLLAWTTPAIADAPRIPHYDLELRADPATGFVEGEVEIAVPRGDGGTAEPRHLHFLLMLNYGETRNPHIIRILEDNGPRGFSPTWAKVEEIRINGATAAYRFHPLTKPMWRTYNEERVLLEVDLPPPSPTRRAGAAPKPDSAESDVVLSFRYQAQLRHTKGLDDFYYGDQMISRFTWFPMVLPPDADLAQLEQF